MQLIREEENWIMKKQEFELYNISEVIMNLDKDHVAVRVGGHSLHLGHQISIEEKSGIFFYTPSITNQYRLEMTESLVKEGEIWIIVERMA